MGIIDTLSAGFGIINRRLWLILLPILLDLFLWWGPRITAGPLIDAGISAYRTTILSASADLTPQDGITDEQIKEFNSQTDLVLEQATIIGNQVGKVNMLIILAWEFPSLMSAYADNVAPLTGPATIAEIYDLSTLFGVIFLLAAINLLVMAFYLGAIAQHVRESNGNKSNFLSSLGLNWARLISLYLLVITVLFFFGVPVLLLIGGLTLLNAGIGQFVSAMISVAIFWAYIYMYFTQGAIFVSEVNPVRAIKQSVTVVRRYFWSAIGFILLISVIGLGTPLAWEKILDNPAGAMVAIIGNAYISTGLIAGTMIFLRDRILPVKNGKVESKAQAGS